MSIVSQLKAVMLGAVLVAMAGIASAQPLRDTSIGLSSASFGTAGARVAKEMGLYEKHGLNPKFVIMDSGNASATALISRSVEFALSGSGELIAAQARGQKVVVIANTYGGSGGTLVLSKTVAEKLGVLSTAPVAERLKALDGLLIGSTSATAGYTTSIRRAAEDAGAKVRFTYMSQPAMAAALESGAIQSYIASAPFWAPPVVRGLGVVWISAPMGELPPEYTPASSGSLQTMREFAEANPELMKSLAAVFTDLNKEIEHHPAEVKAAIAKLYPDLDAPTLDLLFASESRAWSTKPLTANDMAHEIAFVKASGVQLPQIDSVDPTSLLFP
jgi:ABC-type nitrate/sulfonate/bicarbonate transport system substrate-binding protein